MGSPTVEGGNKYVVPDINQNEQPTYGHVSQNIWSQNQIYNLSIYHLYGSIPIQFQYVWGVSNHIHTMVLTH